MKKWHYLAWLLLMIPHSQKTTLLFENGTQHTMQQEMLTLESETAFEGVMYKDDEIFKEIVMDDEQQQVIFDELEPGIYSLYDQEDQLVAQAFYEDDKQHIAFSQPVKLKKDTSYLFKQEPKTYIYDPESKEMKEFKDLKFTYLEKDFEIIVDTSIPNISFDGLKQDTNHIFYTNQPYFTIQYEDEWVDIFDLPKPYQRTETGYQVDVELLEGINDLSCWAKDIVGNVALDEWIVVLDTQAPKVTLPKSPFYTNQEKTFVIEEANLDKERSKIYLNDEEVLITDQQFKLNTTGKVVIDLYDAAGNNSKYDLEFILDTVSPSLHWSIVEQRLSIISSEPLLEHTLQLNDGGVFYPIEDYVFTKDGMFQLYGKLVDQAKNVTWVNEWIQVDVQQPIISIMKEKAELLHENTHIQIQMADTFMKKWEIHLYRHDNLIQSWSGTQNRIQDIYLDETPYLDGKGVYRIEAIAEDNHHQTTFQKMYTVDTKCAPIEMLINGYEANQVEKITLSIPLAFDVSCTESSVVWKLYSKDTLIQSGTDGIIEIVPHQGISHMILEAMDEYGHQQQKRIQFMEVVSNDVIIRDMKKVVEKEEVEEEKKIEEKEIKVKVEEKNDEKAEHSLWLYWVIGGIIIAIIGIQRFAVRRLRFRQSNTDLPSQETISIQDIEE